MDAAIAEFVANGATVTMNLHDDHLREAEETIAKTDKDGDGLVSYDEFPKSPKPKTYVELSSTNGYGKKTATGKQELWFIIPLRYLQRLFSLPSTCNINSSLADK